METTLKFLRDLPQMLAKGGFALAKMVSNSSAVMGEIPEEDRVSGVIHFQDAVMGEDSALGMKLDLSADSFKPAFSQEILMRSIPTNRRDPEALSPLSFLCPGVLAINKGARR